MSETLISVADDLYHHRIPAHWCALAGDSMPPTNWPLAQFLNDLSLRCQHLERIIIQVKSAHLDCETDSASLQETVSQNSRVHTA